ncbi:MAG: FKBP-type peptidyl-prolyl cis-trans isomerase [Tannerella sp.]|jgi:FKBP-type peptidyl-prolyl cis-trans isomerase|nr:FKBP-type peptidyl-prolyl cis-trans isomerase [Tannerella sp.]
MKKFSFLAIAAMVTMGITSMSCDSKKSMGSAKLTSDVDSVSFIIGKAQASNMKKQMESWPIKGNFDAFVAGLMQGIDTPDDSLFLGMDLQGADGFINQFFQNMQTRVAEDNKAEGEKFLAENKAKSGVITTPSGLQYKVIAEGTGQKPAAIDTVVVHYTGRYLDGTQFDSSIERGEPATFPLDRVIAGWTEGLQLMPTGSKYMLWIPSELAYGQGNPNIKPNSTLEFEVELLEVRKAK